MTPELNTESQTSQRVTVTFNPTFWELFLGAMMMIPYQGKLMIVHTIFPVAGLAALIVPRFFQRPIGIGGVVVALLGFLFTPLVTAIGIRSARKNKLAEGPFTYSFDDEGMYVTGVAAAQTIKWSAIPRVVITRRFLYVFVGPAVAYCISMQAVREQSVLNGIRSTASRHTNVQ